MLYEVITVDRLDRHHRPLEGAHHVEADGHDQELDDRIGAQLVPGARQGHHARITSYNVCYTKLLRSPAWSRCSGWPSATAWHSAKATPSSAGLRNNFV